MLLRNPNRRQARSYKSMLNHERRQSQMKRGQGMSAWPHETPLRRWV